MINRKLVFCLLTTIVFSFTLVNGLYEDQIGKFDWRQSYIGKIKYSFLDAVSADKIIVATEDNVLAAISSKDGELLWRRIFESDDNRGEIKFLHVNQQTKTVIQQNSRNTLDIVTVSGITPFLVRGWDINNGNLAWEWSLTPTVPEKALDSMWFLKDSNLYHILPVWGSHIELSEYHASTGNQVKSTTTRISASWIVKDKCVLSKSNFACLSKDQLLVLDLLADNSNVKTKQLDVQEQSIELVKGQDGYVSVGSLLINLKELSVVSRNNDATSLYIENSLLQLVVKDKAIKITSTDLTNSQNEKEISFITDSFESANNNLHIVSAKCKTKTEKPACRIVLSSADGAIILVQQSNIKWTREEALTKISDVDFIDLTLSDAQGAIEEELNNKDADIMGSLTRRLHSQYGMIKNIILAVLGLGAPESASQKAGLVRDDFGLHKMVVIVTESGKIFGIDNMSGKQHWVKFLPGFGSFKNDQGLKLLVQRTSKFYPLPAQCAIVGRDQITGKGLLYQFNPITGHGSIKKLDYAIKQVMLLPTYGADFLKALLLIDQDFQAHTEPAKSLSQVNGFYFYLADKETGVVTGYYISYENNKAVSTATWNASLGGFYNEQKIIAIASKNSIEKVHSQGRVLADRSVLYKYINPNLVAFATEGPDSIHKYILNVYLIDVVSGSIVFSLSHRRVKGPLKMIHSENWLVYSFYNEKVRRHEMTTIELYEGKTQMNSTVWSSLHSPPFPLVERQTYIIPTSVAALRETITEKGISNKDVLIGLNTGNVLEMPWALLDPRRHSMISPEKQREEGIIPYIPELPLQPEAMINYNLSVARIAGIHTAPSGLESTCLAIVYGLDIFVTRVAPSKTFDLLKEDFDYFLISIVLIGLTAASYICKHLASKKLIKQAWK